MKPTVGLVSRSGIIPISSSQDTAGPMARTVMDAAILLTAIAGTDPQDAVTADASVRAVDYAKVLDRDALKGARIGVVRSQFGGRNDLVTAQVEKALQVMRDQGATLVDLAEVPNAGKLAASEYEVLLHELKAGLPLYLSEYAPHAPVKTLADVIAFNERESARELKYFRQEHFLKAEAKGGLDSPEYLAAVANNRKFAREEGIDKALRENDLDALVAPSGSPAWLTDFVRGDFSGGGFSQPAAVAGYPHITVPAGFVNGLPCGISFVGTAWSEARLIALAYAFEQATKHRRAPRYRKTINGW
jgi:amidase